MKEFYALSGKTVPCADIDRLTINQETEESRRINGP